MCAIVRRWACQRTHVRPHCPGLTDYCFTTCNRSSLEHHRRRGGAGDPGFPRQPDRGGRGRADLGRPRARGRAERGQHGRPRGGRAPRRRGALRRKRGAGRSCARERRDPGRDRRNGRGRPADPRRRVVRARRHRSEGPPRRECDPRRLARGRESRCRGMRHAAVPLCRRHERARAARTDDERAQRWRARRQQRRPAGVHDRADRRGELQRGAALGIRDVSRVEGAC